MQYQPLLVAALAAISNAAATPSQITLAYTRVSSDLALLSRDIATSGPSASSITSYNKAILDLETFDDAIGDANPHHPCPAILLKPATTKQQAENYIKTAEKDITAAYGQAVKAGSSRGTEVCVAQQYLNAVGTYVGAYAA